MVMVNSKNVLDVKEKVLKIKLLPTSLMILTPISLNIFSLVTNSYTSSFTLPSSLFKALSFAHYGESGLTLLLTKFEAF